MSSVEEPLKNTFILLFYKKYQHFFKKGLASCSLPLSSLLRYSSTVYFVSLVGLCSAKKVKI